MALVFVIITLVLTLFCGYALQKVFHLYFFTASPSSNYVPGLQASPNGTGNLDAIGKSGSLHEFLIELHNQFGEIAGFWLGPLYVVSISTPNLFKDHQSIFDRPPELFQLFEPLLGPKSIQYANGNDGRSRRKYLDRCMSFQAVQCYIPEFQRIAEEISECFAENLAENHPLCSYMANFALKAGILTMFGNTQDNQQISDFHRDYQIMWSEMESRLAGGMPTVGSDRELAFKKALLNCQLFVKDIVASRKGCNIDPDDKKLIDVLMDKSVDDETLVSDAITYVVGGFHTTANLLSWCLYYLSTSTHVQEKLQSELDENIEIGGPITSSIISNMSYLRQVINETLRCSVLAPWAARVQSKPTVLGGYNIPQGTPVIHALGVSLQNSQFWPNPDVFDPERFSVENTRKRPNLSFEPFGFAGKRVCPGYRFAYSETAVCLIVLLQKFNVSLANTQDIKRVYGLVTHPSEEIIVKVAKRH